MTNDSRKRRKREIFFFIFHSSQVFLPRVLSVFFFHSTRSFNKALFCALVALVSLLFFIPTMLARDLLLRALGELKWVFFGNFIATMKPLPLTTKIIDREKQKKKQWNEDWAQQHLGILTSFGYKIKRVKQSNSTDADADAGIGPNQVSIPLSFLLHLVVKWKISLSVSSSICSSESFFLDTILQFPPFDTIWLSFYSLEIILLSIAFWQFLHSILSSDVISFFFKAKVLKYTCHVDRHWYISRLARTPLHKIWINSSYI